MIKRVLIANRGEIAVRVIRGCRELGIETVAVYSEADASASHVLAAHDAVAIGSSAASASYLNAAAILDAAATTGADAIHPGYGFLSENANFARACEARGLVFIGPSSTVIERMGSKTAAREAVAKAGVPVVPGDTPKSQKQADVLASLTRVGYPALLKASAGGGGKGMRIVTAESEAADAIAAARSEAERSFADGTMYVERLIERPRHIEVQIMADGHGSTVHLFERDCTLQRRHQKVIEEAPGPTVTPAMRERMTRAAVAAAQAVGYVNAGTIEFLLSGDEFYFLEMNTRLQVEHPITECVTGVDLVRAQLLVASGERLPFSQSDLTIRGAAVECRVYAEDPSANFLPQAGPLLRYREPQGPGVRVDAGVAEGQQITVHYDPMIAKVITSGETREAAWARASLALRNFEILGLRHNIAFLLALLHHPDVLACRTHTRFIEERLTELTAAPPDVHTHAQVALAALLGISTTTAATHHGSNAIDPWTTLGKVDW
ncbi:MAG: acetyl-CoA carboxylase biotin carboxylase subunit [Vicinamibacterales bacterium]